MDIEIESDIDTKKMQLKLLRIKKNRKKKDNNYYNYTNIAVLPTIYDDIPTENADISFVSLQSSSIHPPPALTYLSNPPAYNNGLFHNNIFVGDNTSSEKTQTQTQMQTKDITKDKKNTFIYYLSSTYNYFFPLKEGATSSGGNPLKLQFWSLPCDFLNMSFYTNLITTIVVFQDTYIQGNKKDMKNLKSDSAIIKSLIDHSIMILIAFIMTYNVYYFIFMYRWDCRHSFYVPGHGMYFGKSANDIIDFILRDVRIPVYYCQYIYTEFFPAIFGMFEMRRYKRVCFVFLFLFMLCFVFITGKKIGLSSHSFITSGKINPLVAITVLFSVFIGLFFTKEADLITTLQNGLNANETCTGDTVSNEVFDFSEKENIEKINGRPYYYSIVEKYKDFQEELKTLKTKKDDKLIDKINSFLTTYQGVYDTYQKKGGYEVSGGGGKGPEPAVPEVSAVPGGLPAVPDLSKFIDPAMATKLQKIQEKAEFFSTLAFGKFYTVIMAIIRIVIAIALLPVAQIFVSWFFFYTTSGIGLLIEEGFKLFIALRKIKCHMNDNNGIEIDKGKGGGDTKQSFYESVNNTQFFKFWVNELFLTSIYTIFCIVKFITVPIKLSRNSKHGKIIAAIIIGTISVWLILRSYLLHNRHCNLDVKNCYFKQLKQTEIQNTSININQNDGKLHQLDEQRKERFTKMTDGFDNYAKTKLDIGQPNFDDIKTKFDKLFNTFNEFIVNPDNYRRTQQLLYNNIIKNEKGLLNKNKKIIKITNEINEYHKYFVNNQVIESEKIKSFQDIQQYLDGLNTHLQNELNNNSVPVPVPKGFIDKIANSKIIIKDKNKLIIKLVIDKDDNLNTINNKILKFKLEKGDIITIDGIIELGSIDIDNTKPFITISNSTKEFKFIFKLNSEIFNNNNNDNSFLQEISDSIVEQINNILVFYKDNIKPQVDKYNKLVKEPYSNTISKLIPFQNPKPTIFNKITEATTKTDQK